MLVILLGDTVTNPLLVQRPKVTLVARMVAAVGNYDYIFNWEFQTAGLIRIKVGLSGILMVNLVPESR